MSRSVAGGRPWDLGDKTGGPLDAVLAQVRDRCPGVRVERLTVTHPADDDNVYSLGDEDDPSRVQVDTCPGGYPPFIIESNTARIETSNVEEAATVISEWLT